MRSPVSILIATLALTGCGMVDGRSDAHLRETRLTSAPAKIRSISDGPAKIGRPYSVDGVGYTPADDRGYEAVGYASWYGDELEGNRTANGERFDPDGISAAHRTLPMPSYLEVTSLDTGRTILVRVNDRGPFTRNRLIDLSKGAARQLGISGHGHAAVRIRRVEPDGDERAKLARGGKVRERERLSSAELADLRDRMGLRGRTRAVLTSEPVPADYARLKGHWYVQLGSFTGEERARSLASRSGARIDHKGMLHRVRFGPFDTEREANDSLRATHRKGYPEARVIRDD